MLIEPMAKNNLEMWMNADLDAASRDEIEALLNTPKQLNDAFYTRLSFGTGGLRGLMGVGSNRINKYTIRMTTQGLANYLTRHNAENSVFIAYDSRRNSRLFAEEAAKVLAGNGIRAYVTKELRPTPLASFGCRYLQCTAAIMITASHNPPEYNGYKVYWSDGAQVIPPHDQGIVDEVNNITDMGLVKSVDSFDHPLITLVGEEIDNAYLEEIKPLQFYKDANRQHGRRLNIVYTSLHGTGITLMPQAMQAWGFNNLLYVDSQIIPDGGFATVKSPNPEDREALSLGIKRMEDASADLLIATDPDADRVGVALRHKGKTYLLNGNQMACILLYHICEALKGQMKPGTAFVKTIATTELFREIAESYGGFCFDVLTGFKFIAEKIRTWEKEPKGYHYLFGGEESYGYLLGTYVRDKDAIISSALIAETALHAKLNGKTLIDVLHEIWSRYGVYVEKLLSLTFPESKEGKEQMQLGMEKLLKNPPETLAGLKVAVIENYLDLVRTDVGSGEKTALPHRNSDMLLFKLEDGSKLLIRPSGTEPKIKIYCGVHKKTDAFAKAEKELEQHAEQLVECLKNLF